MPNFSELTTFERYESQPGSEKFVWHKPNAIITPRQRQLSNLFLWVFIMFSFVQLLSFSIACLFTCPCVSAMKSICTKNSVFQCTWNTVIARKEFWNFSYWFLELSILVLSFVPEHNENHFHYKMGFPWVFHWDLTIYQFLSCLLGHLLNA